jgi:hypothetical protein
VIRVNDLVADLVVHRFGCPPQETHKEYITIVLEESRYIQWNQEVRENWVRIWQSNCLGGGVCVRRWMRIRNSSMPEIADR